MTARKRRTCEFCPQARPARWLYPARLIDVFPEKGTRGWLACDVCHELIEADDWEGLERRYVARFYTVARVRSGPGWRQDVEQEIRANWRRFREARTGPARPYTPRGKAP
jgi:hypothetical protein